MEMIPSTKNLVEDDELKEDYEHESITKDSIDDISISPSEDADDEASLQSSENSDNNDETKQRSAEKSRE